MKQTIKSNGWNLWSVSVVYTVKITERVWRIASESDVAVIVFHDLDSHGSLELRSEGLQAVRHVAVETVFSFLSEKHQE